MNPAIILLAILILIVFILFASPLAKPLGRLIKGEANKWKNVATDDEDENSEDI